MLILCWSIKIINHVILGANCVNLFFTNSSYRAKLALKKLILNLLSTHALSFLWTLIILSFGNTFLQHNQQFCHFSASRMYPQEGLGIYSLFHLYCRATRFNDLFYISRTPTNAGIRDPIRREWELFNHSQTLKGSDIFFSTCSIISIKCKSIFL